jgi:hypothetical protein
LPEFSLPKPRLPRPQFTSRKQNVDIPRNAWAEQNPNIRRPSALQAVKNGAHRVGDSTRSAWRKTVDALKPGDDSQPASSRIARRTTTKPPFWKRMFGADEQEPQGPRTISEWMAQERLDP